MACLGDFIYDLIYMMRTDSVEWLARKKGEEHGEVKEIVRVAYIDRDCRLRLLV